MSTATRIKPPTIIATREEFEDTVNRIAYLRGQREQIKAEAEHDIETIRISAAALDAPIKEEEAAAVTKAERYATAHRDTLLGKLKSAVLALAKWGFRKRTRTDRPDDLIDRIRAAGLHELLVVTERPDLAKISRLPEAEKLALGITETTFDEFFVEPKKEAPRPGQS